MDQITHTIQYSDNANNLLYYDVYYTLDDGNGHLKGIKTTVQATDMANSSDLVELTNTANAQAAIMKTQWLASLVVPVALVIKQINGPVTLVGVQLPPPPQQGQAQLGP